jgi:hypothetical protein
MARNFSCGSFTVVCGMDFFLYNDGLLPVDTTDDIWDAEPEFCSAWGPGQCSGGSPDGSGSATYSWTIGAASIITPSSSTSQAPPVTGVGPGSGTGSVEAEAEECGSNGSGPATVPDPSPVITGIDPSDWNASASTPTSTAVTFTGQYFGTNKPTLAFSPSAGISTTISSYNDTQIVATVSIAAGTPNEDVAVTVTNNGYGSSAFNGQSSGNSPTSAPVYAQVRSPLNTSEITVIGWINGNAPDLATLPTGENSALQTQLTPGLGCGLLVTSWSILLIPTDVVSAADSAYANAWLLKYSANSAPPASITPSAQFSAGNYRIFSDFGHGSGALNVGVTPDPCGLGVIPAWVGTGEASPYMGKCATSNCTSPSGEIYQLAEGRIGKMGQRGSQTINGGRTVPWIWSVIEFSSSGTPTYSNHAMFPTYSVYTNGLLTTTFAQSPVATFVANDDSYQLTPSQIP